MASTIFAGGPSEIMMIGTFFDWAALSQLTAWVDLRLRDR
jgi:hypothetical protein